MHWRRKWQPTPVLLPGESQGWGHTELDTTEVTAAAASYCWGFPSSSVVKKLSAIQEPQEMQVRSLGWEDPLR